MEMEITGSVAEDVLILLNMTSNSCNSLIVN